MTELRRLQIFIAPDDVDGLWYVFMDDSHDTLHRMDPGYEARDDAMVVARLECERVRQEFDKAGIPWLRTL